MKAKINAVLGQHKALLSITDPTKLPATLTNAEKETMEVNAYGTIVLNVTDNVLRQIVDQKTTYALWNKLNEIYLHTSLPNKAFLRERLFTNQMDASKSLTDNVNDFKRLSSEFKSIGDNIGEKNEVFILLNN